MSSMNENFKKRVIKKFKIRVFVDETYIWKLGAAKSIGAIKKILYGFQITTPIISWSPQKGPAKIEKEQTKEAIIQWYIDGAQILNVNECVEKLKLGKIPDGTVVLVLADKAMKPALSIKGPDELDSAFLKEGAYFAVRGKPEEVPLDNEIFLTAWLIETTEPSRYGAIKTLFGQTNPVKDYVKKIFETYNNFHAMILGVVQPLKNYVGIFYPTVKNNSNEISKGLITVSMWVKEPEFLSADIKPMTVKVIW